MNWTPEEIQIIKDNHGKITLPQILKLLPYPRTYFALRKKAQFLGLFRDKSKNNLPNFHPYNSSYWEYPNLINCYLGGLIGSDGHLGIDKRGKSFFCYGVAIKDELLIDLFLKELSGSYPKQHYLRPSPHYPDRLYEYVCVRFNSFEKCAIDLEKHFNLTPQKTQRLGPTNLTDINLNLAYCTGLIDGDGHISFSRPSDTNKERYVRLTIGYVSSSEAVVRWMKNIVDTHFNLINHYHKAGVSKDKRDNCYKYHLTGLRACIIFDYLSQIPVPKLQRKWGNPEILAYVASKKQKYPHLFIPYGSLKTIELPKIENSQNSISQSSILV